MNLLLKQEILEEVGVVLDEHVDSMIGGSVVDDQVKFVVVVNGENWQDTFGPGACLIES